jgi:phosphoribosylformylglycinamidine synthase
MLDIAGICNPQGNVLGLMPHPENHIHPWQHPQWRRGVVRNSGLTIFKNGVKYAEEA